MAQLLALCISALFITISPADAQFLSRDFRDLWSNEVFENYGTAGYRDYDFNEENRRFDYFGDLLIDGVDIVRYSEIRRDLPGIPGSYESRNARYDRFFDKLVISLSLLPERFTTIIFSEESKFESPSIE